MEKQIIENDIGTKKTITLHCYYLQLRHNANYIQEEFYDYLLAMIKNHKKGIYQISPNFTIVVK
jgi:hypothetical protein